MGEVENSERGGYNTFLDAPCISKNIWPVHSSGELRSKVNCASPHARWGVRLPLAPWTLHALTVSPAIELDGPYPTNFPTAEPSRSSTRSHVALKHGAPNPERGIGRAGGGGSDRAENENDAVRPIAAAPVVATAAMPLAASPSP